jgi:hypothetical protein
MEREQFEGAGFTAHAALRAAAYKALSRLEEDDHGAAFWGYRGQWEAGLAWKSSKTVAGESVAELLGAKVQIKGGGKSGGGGGGRRKGRPSSKKPRHDA